MLNYLFYHDVSDAFVTKAEAGFGGDRRMQSARFLETSLNVHHRRGIEDRPVLPPLEKMVGEGLIAISDVEVIRYTHREA